jgi:hypothetical protein
MNHDTAVMQANHKGEFQPSGRFLDQGILMTRISSAITKKMCDKIKLIL